MTTSITEFCDGVLALDGKATPIPWVQGTVFFGDVYSPAEAMRSRQIVEGQNKDEQQIHDVRLIAAYRSSAPALARALKKAVEGLEQFTSDLADPYVRKHASRALAEIAELIPKE